MTPSPHTGPRDAGITTEVMRATMAATGGRNQRRIANLKTVTSKDVNPSDSEDEILLSSLRDQKSISYHMGWSNERDRLEKLVDMSESMGDEISEAEKKENRVALYQFLKRPHVAQDSSIPTSSKRARESQQTPTVRLNSTPASAAANLPSMILPDNAIESTDESIFPSIEYSPSPVSITAKLVPCDTSNFI